MVLMDTLTAREEDVLEAIKELTEQEGYAPTVRQLCDLLDMRSPATVHDHLNRLEAKGAIRRSPDARRLILVVKGTR